MSYRQLITVYAQSLTVSCLVKWSSLANSSNFNIEVKLSTIVDKKLGQELAADRTAGPFTSPPFQSFCVSPLGLIPKKIPGGFRLIHHLSFPKGMSINDGIASENTHVQYARVSDAIKLIKRAGPGCYLAKTGVKWLPLIRGAMARTILLRPLYANGMFKFL